MTPCLTAYLGFLFRGVGNDDSAGGLAFRVDTPNQNAIAQGTESHFAPPLESQRFDERMTGAGIANEPARLILGAGENPDMALVNRECQGFSPFRRQQASR
jgi:hypothetical protein